MTKITELLASNDAVNAIAEAVEALPGGVKALEDAIAHQLSPAEPVVEAPAEETPVV